MRTRAFAEGDLQREQDQRILRNLPPSPSRLVGDTTGRLAAQPRQMIASVQGHVSTRGRGGGQDVRMADLDFEFIVEESFQITGRGVGVFGEWRSGQFTSGDSGYVQLDAEVIAAVSRIDIEYARVPGGERVALLLHDVTVTHVPAGSVVRSGPVGSKALG